MKKIVYLRLFLWTVLLFGVMTLGGTAQVTLTASGVASAGGISTGGVLTIASAVGQSSPPGSAPGTPFSLQGGMIYSLTSAQGVDQTGPTVNIYGFTPPNPGSQLTVDAQVSDPSGVLRATLWYRMGGGAGFDSAVMSKTGLVYEGIVPGSMVTSRGLELYVTAVDSADNLTRKPASGILAAQVRAVGAGVGNPAAQPAGSDQTAYRLISIPIDADTKTPAAVLADDFGAYDNTHWRFFQLKTTQSNPDSLYTEYPNTANMDPGRAFWLITRDQGKVITTGPGLSILTDRTYSIPLNPGWTFVGDPFNFNVPLTSVTLQSGASLDIRSYSGSWAAASGPLVPFQGYAVSNTSTSYDTLLVNPVLTPPSAAQPQGGTSEAPAWSIRIRARCQQAVDDDNTILASSSASAGLDKLDRPEPPVIGEYVSVSFPHPEWKNVFRKFTTDARPGPQDGDTWTMEVASNIEDRVSLSFEGVEGVPEGFSVWMVDEATKVSQNLRETASYSYMNYRGAPARAVRILIGTREYVQGQLTSFGAVPQAFSLFQNYPNPFNPATTIRYALPEPARVSLRVYALTGQLVATLLDGLEGTGFHSVLFDASTLPSGVYYYRLQAGSFSEVKKLLLLR